MVSEESSTARRALPRLLAALLLAALADCREMCKAFSETSKFDLAKIHKDYLNLGGLVVAETTYTVYADMCRPLDASRVTHGGGSTIDYEPDKSGLKPNVILKLTHLSGRMEFKDIGFYYDQAASLKNNPWSAAVFTHQGEKPASSLEYSRILRSENVTTVAIEFKPTKYKDVVAKILFLNTCFRDSNYHFYDNYYVKATKTVVFQYNGPDACGVEIPNYIDFLSSGISFVLILGISALIGLVLDKDNERLIMALSSVQASIMSFTSLCFFIRDWVDLKADTTKHVYAVLCLLCASVSFGLSYFNRVISLAFVCVSVSYTVVWTLLYLIMLIFKQNVPTAVHLAGNILVVCAIVVVSTRSEKIREKYSYFLYTAVTNSFYLCLAWFVFKNKFIDIINFNNFREYGKEDSVSFENWYFIFVQSLVTAVTVYRQVRQGRKLSRKHNEKAKGSRLVSERITTNENDLFGDHKNPNETLIAM
jgi:hypothetical protein